MVVVEACVTQQHDPSLRWDSIQAGARHPPERAHDPTGLVFKQNQKTESDFPHRSTFHESTVSLCRVWGLRNIIEKSVDVTLLPKSRSFKKKHTHNNSI